MKSRSDKRNRTVDPGLVGLWTTAKGEIVRVAEDGWYYRIETLPYEISPDGMMLTFPSANPVPNYLRVYGSGQSLVGVWSYTFVDTGVTYVEEITFRSDGSYGFYWTADGVFDSQGFGIFEDNVTSVTREERRSLLLTTPPDSIVLDIPYDPDQSGTYQIAADGMSWTLMLRGTATVYTRIVTTAR